MYGGMARWAAAWAWRRARGPWRARTTWCKNFKGHVMPGPCTFEAQCVYKEASGTRWTSPVAPFCTTVWERDLPEGGGYGLSVADDLVSWAGGCIRAKGPQWRWVYLLLKPGLDSPYGRQCHCRPVLTMPPPPHHARRHGCGPPCMPLPWPTGAPTASTMSDTKCGKRDLLNNGFALPGTSCTSAVGLAWDLPVGGGLLGASVASAGETA